jgi:hypothetical protein
MTFDTSLLGAELVSNDVKTFYTAIFNLIASFGA